MLLSNLKELKSDMVNKDWTICSFIIRYKGIEYMSVDGKMAFLHVSADEDNWVAEKLVLEKGRHYAVVVGFEKMTASVEQISYVMINGGPLFISE